MQVFLIQQIDLKLKQLKILQVLEIMNKIDHVLIIVMLYLIQKKKLLLREERRFPLKIM